MKKIGIGKMENTENTANAQIAQVEAGVEKLKTMFDELDAGIKETGDLIGKIFSPNDVLSDFMEALMDEERCLAWLIRRLHGADWSCPSCRRAVNDNLIARYFEGGRIKCSSCGTFFTALSGTFLSGVHFNNRQIIAMCLLIALGIDDKRIAEIVGINKESVRTWRKKFNDGK